MFAYIQDICTFMRKHPFICVNNAFTVQPNTFAEYWLQRDKKKKKKNLVLGSS